MYILFGNFVFKSTVLAPFASWNHYDMKQQQVFIEYLKILNISPVPWTFLWAYFWGGRITLGREGDLLIEGIVHLKMFICIQEKNKFYTHLMDDTSQEHSVTTKNTN